jgi:2-haloacid dehalogenase
MKRAYPWLWFDADGTLFDWEHAEVTAFAQAFADLGTPCGAGYLEVYRRINRDLWAAVERHDISPGDLKERRFALLAEELGLPCTPAELSAAYVARLAERAELIDGALEVLDDLRPRCRLAIVTNGLGAVQHSRIARSAPTSPG